MFDLSTTGVVQADTLNIEAQAKRRLADEYDAAQARSEIRRRGRADNFEIIGKKFKPTAADVGLPHELIYEARQIRDAEARDPGIVRQKLGPVEALG